MTYALSWTPFALVVLVALRAMWRSGLLVIKKPHGWVTVLPTRAVMALGVGGALAYVGMGVGGGLFGGSQATGTAAAAEYGSPNTPTFSTVVIDTSTVYALGSAFVGSLDDTHDSIRFAVTRLSADTTTILTETYGGAQIRDTVSDNANLKADTTYKGWLKYKGANGGWSAWSAPDTFVNVTTVFEELWESYTSGEDFLTSTYDSTDFTGSLSYWRSSGSNLISLETGLTTPWGGTKAMKILYDGTVTTVGLDIPIPDAATHQATEFWFEEYVQFSSDFDTENSNGSENPDFKFNFFFTDDGVGRTEFKVGNGSIDNAQLNLGMPGGVDCGDAGACADSSNIALSDSLFNGSWELIRIYADLVGDGSSGCVISASFNDQPWIYHQQSFAHCGVNETSGNFWTAFSVGENNNREQNANVQILIGRMRLYLTDPGWSHMDGN